MVNLKEITGIVVFSPNGNYIVGASDEQNAEFQQKCQRPYLEIPLVIKW